jgi:hypothetical protein
MRLRPKRLRATVSVKTDPQAPRPVTLSCGPAWQFDLGLDEAHTLAVELADAIEAAGGQGAS